MNTKSRKRYLPTADLRNQSGSAAMLIPLGILLVIIGLGAFSADIAHNVSVRTEMQSATDAGALAGAAALVDPNTAPMATYNAQQVAGLNKADGNPVSTTSPNTNVSVAIDNNVPGEIGTCQVTASQPIQNWMGSLFGHGSDTISVTSTAAASQTINQVASNMLFPLTISLDAVPTDKNGSQLPLGKLNQGDTIYIYINSQQVKNGAFTSFTVKNTDANWFNSAIDQNLGLSSPQSNFIPQTKIGDQIFLDNGVAGQKALAKGAEFSAVKAKDELILPVIEGTPPMVQARPVIGFVVIKVSDVVINQSGGQVEAIVGTLVHAAVRGQKGDVLGAGLDASEDAQLKTLSPSNVRLIANSQGF
jgi:hypothetical protein